MSSSSYYYPSYLYRSYGGYASSSNYGRSLYGYGSYIYYPSYYSDGYYGNRRNRLYYWERDRDYDRRMRRWRRRNRRDTPSPPPPPPKPEPPKEESVKVLTVKTVDFHVKANTEKHRTNEFFDCSEKKDPELVLRRGDTFKMSVTFDRPYSKQKNDMKLIFSIGPKPLETKGTKVVLVMDESGNKKFKPDEWGATMQDKTGNDITILIQIACNAIVGEWNFYIESFSEGKDKDGKEKTLKFTYEHNMDVTILFNPWCKDDGVYMANESELEEYVLNDNGLVYRGNGYQIESKPWNFGQFEEDILDICLHLMRSGFKGGVSKSMSDPVIVSRMIAKLVNLADDNKDADKGVLVGNWSGEYDDGISPLKWAGSVNILQQWRKSGPVKYGQCWVFSCVTTTVCRALGIPCRSVTNFSSAHDTDGSMCIEKYYGPDGEALEEYNSDSIWNFHVWNEVWVSRPDLKELKPGYEYLRKSGWQVIDATPQKLSDGVYTCGPCPVKAVYAGYVEVNYDTPFVFAEVDSDVVNWTLRGAYDYSVTKVSKNSTGKLICTKKADGKAYSRDLYQDEFITSTYKPDEGTKEERDTVKHALSTLDWNYMEWMKADQEGNVEFHLIHDNNTMIGSDLKIQLTAKNHEYVDTKIISAKISVAPKKYSGEVGKAFFIENLNVDHAFMNPNQELRFTSLMKHELYMPKVEDQAHFSIVANIRYWKTGRDEPYIATKEHDFRFRRPDLEVTCPKSARKGEKINFEVSFRNPLDVALTKCDMTVESAGGIETFEDQKQADVPAKGEYRRVFPLLAKRVKKNATVSFSFDCAQLKDVSGGNSIEIKNDI